MGNLYEQYYKWIDWDMFEGLSEEEQEALENKNHDKYGLNYILKPGAPIEAIKAWKEDARQTREAEKEGKILN